MQSSFIKNSTINQVNSKTVNVFLKLIRFFRFFVFFFFVRTLKTFRKYNPCRISFLMFCIYIYMIPRNLRTTFTGYSSCFFQKNTPKIIFLIYDDIVMFFFRTTKKHLLPLIWTKLLLKKKEKPPQTHPTQL